MITLKNYQKKKYKNKIVNELTPSENEDHCQGSEYGRIAFAFAEALCLCSNFGRYNFGQHNTKRINKIIVWKILIKFIFLGRQFELRSSQWRNTCTDTSISNWDQYQWCNNKWSKKEIGFSWFILVTMTLYAISYLTRLENFEVAVWAPPCRSSRKHIEKINKIWFWRYPDNYQPEWHQKLDKID